MYAFFYKRILFKKNQRFRHKLYKIKLKWNNVCLHRDLWWWFAWCMTSYKSTKMVSTLHLSKTLASTTNRHTGAGWKEKTEYLVENEPQIIYNFKAQLLTPLLGNSSNIKWEPIVSIIIFVGFFSAFCTIWRFRWLTNQNKIPNCQNKCKHFGGVPAH